jgi:predicted nucleotidyltransferase
MDGRPEDEVTRPPEERDLIGLARELNRLGVRYVVIGGLAINRLGYVRATDDIDLLIARDLANQRRIKQALEILPDKAVRDLGDDDLAQWLVVRVNDEITVDLMTEACGVGFEEACGGIEMVVIDGVPIPFAGAELMLKLKQGAREKDGMDRKFLERLLAPKQRQQEP